MRILLFLLMLCALPLKAEPILADLSMRQIDINTTFRGADLLLFGARNDAGDIVVVVRGPRQDYVVRKKERIGGIWVNNRKEKFFNVPTFYTIASSRPLQAMENQALMQSYGVGGEFMDAARMAGDAQKKEFWNALVAHKNAAGLYAVEEGEISFWGETLFKTLLNFPKNIMRGTYLAEIYLFRDGGLSAVQTTPIQVEKIGFEAYVYTLAHQMPLLYGLLAVAIAYLAGWLASTMFRKI